jgi:hypothetical protein
MRSFPRRNSSSVSVRMVVSARRKSSICSSSSAIVLGLVSQTCSRASRWNPAAANAWHVSSSDGKVSTVRAVSGNQRTSSIRS